MKGHKFKKRLAERIKWYEELLKRLPPEQHKGYSKPGSGK